MWSEFPRFFTQRAVGSFCTAADEMNGIGRSTRKKTTHTQGLVAHVEWVPVEGHRYSGIYASGSDTVIMRLSESFNLTEESTGLTPSVAFKFLIDGK